MPKCLLKSRLVCKLVSFLQSVSLRVYWNTIRAKNSGVFLLYSEKTLVFLTQAASTNKEQGSKFEPTQSCHQTMECAGVPVMANVPTK